MWFVHFTGVLEHQCLDTNLPAAKYLCNEWLWSPSSSFLLCKNRMSRKALRGYRNLKKTQILRHLCAQHAFSALQTLQLHYFTFVLQVVHAGEPGSSSYNCSIRNKNFRYAENYFRVHAGSNYVLLPYKVALTRLWIDCKHSFPSPSREGHVFWDVNCVSSVSGTLNKPIPKS